MNDEQSTDAAEPSDPAEPAKQLPRFRWLRGIITGGLIAGLCLGIIGQLVRDRALVLAILFYLPLPLIAVAAVAWDLLLRGRSVPRARFGLTVFGLTAAAVSAYPMIGWDGGNTPTGLPDGSDVIRVLHWNVLWGHDRKGTGKNRPGVIDELRGRGGGADFIVLNEAPAAGAVAELTKLLGPNWSSAMAETGTPNGRYYSRVAVCSPWPLRHLHSVPVANGSADLFVADVRGRPVRLLVVDGVSDPRVLRTPLLHGVADACDRAAAAGEPIDLIAGDFNSLARCVGFDRLAQSGAAGYALASRASAEWRGTFPSVLPLYDIDHVWVRADWRIVGCDLFTSKESDHRGQVARVVCGP